MEFERAADFFSFRIFNHAEVPAEKYDSVLQLDIDIIAVKDIEPLFPRGNAMWVTWSNFGALGWEHARHIMPRWRYGLYRLNPKTRHTPGVSACFVGCKGEHYHDYLERWTRLMRDGEAKYPTPHLREQSYLNLAWLKSLFPMEIVGRDKFQHGGQSLNDGVRMWHFPNVPDRLNVMKDRAAELGLGLSTG